MGGVYTWLRSCFTTCFIHCFSHPSDSQRSEPASTTQSTSTIEPTPSNHIPLVNNVVQEIRTSPVSSRTSSDRQRYVLRSLSSRSSSIEMFNLQGDMPLELSNHSSSNTDNTKTNPVSPRIVRESSSPASTLSFDEDDEDMKFSVEWDDECEEPDQEDEGQDCNVNGNEEETGMENDLDTVDSKTKLEDLSEVEKVRQSEAMSNRSDSQNSDPSVSESRLHLSVDMAVKFFDELEQQSDIGGTTSGNASEQITAHVQKCSARIASAAQKFGDTADH